MRKLLATVPVLGMLVMAAPAQAAPIVASAGDTLTFNFDFVAANAVPAPPYLTAQFNTGTDFSTLNAGDQATWTIYSDLNGGGTQLDVFVQNLFSDSSSSLGDGVFSVILSVTAGSFTVDPFAFGRGAQGQDLTGRVDPLQPNALPEPATLSLLGGGLVVAALRRRRHA